MDLPSSAVIGLTGASGGLGTSTLAGAVAGLAGALGRTTLLVDLLPNAGGLDQLGGCAHEPGQRWPWREEGMASLRSRDLPVWGGVRVLAQRGPVLPAPTLGRAALQAVGRLAGEHHVTVLDLPRADHPQAVRWFGLCDVVVLVAGTAPPLVACALTARSLVTPGALVLRAGPGDGLAADDVAAVLGLPLLGRLRHDPAVALAVLEQEWPGRADGPVRETAWAVLAQATGAAGQAA